MATLTDLIRGSAKTDFPALSGMWYATIAAPLPVNRNQLLNVIIPDIDINTKWSNVRWPKMQFNNLVVGSSVLVAFDNRQQLWVVSQVLSAPLTTTRDIALGPPPNPSDGDIWIATNIDAAGTRWQFQYNANSASAHKWEFIGGSETFGTASSGIYSALPSGSSAQSPIFITPRAGDWDCMGASQFTGPTAAGQYLSLGVGTAASNSVGLTMSLPFSGAHVSITTSHRPTNVPSGTQISLFVFASSTDSSSANRWMRVLPVRIS